MIHIMKSMQYMLMLQQVNIFHFHKAYNFLLLLQNMFQQNKKYIYFHLILNKIQNNIYNIYYLINNNLLYMMYKLHLF